MTHELQKHRLIRRLIYCELLRVWDFDQFCSTGLGVLPKKNWNRFSAALQCSNPEKDGKVFKYSQDGIDDAFPQG